jgi:protein-S-isoprenylcysteine O-methyltransferase Ste14
MSATPWWKNSRGELFVIAQFIVIALVAMAPRTLSGLPEWSSGFRTFGSIAGGLMILSGLSLAAAGALKLGHNLTPLITPKESGVLLEQGAYGLVRHPIYSGILQLAFGWGLRTHGWLTLGYALLLFVILDRKARREEVILHKVFPGYASYSRRVRRLIPFIY